MAGRLSLSRLYLYDGGVINSTARKDRGVTETDLRDLLVVDAFTDVPFGGNPAGVLLEAEDLTDEQMLAIAREVNASETAFLCRGVYPGPFNFRYFTPAAEVPLCGHATIAAFHALLWEGAIPVVEGEMVVHLDARAGLLQIRLKVEEGKLERVMMGQQPPQYEPFRLDLDILAAALGTESELLNRADGEVGPPVIVSTGCRCLHAALPDLASVRAANPDFRALAGLSSDLDVITVQIVTLETVSDQCFAHVRTFAPAVGVDEDPVTGTAAGSLGGYLAYINDLPGEGDRRRLFVEQGAEVGRAGQVEVELQLVGQAVSEVWVGGKAVRTLKGRIAVPRHE
jgi:PhzF family phenazine biosynthesis protein